MKMKYDFYMIMNGLTLGVFLGIIFESMGYGKYLLAPSFAAYLYLKYGIAKVDG